MFVIIALVFNLLMIGSTVDGYGHLGGAITGFLWGMAFLPRVKTSGPNNKKIGLIGLVVFFVLFATLLFTIR